MTTDAGVNEPEVSRTPTLGVSNGVWLVGRVSMGPQRVQLQEGEAMVFRLVVPRDRRLAGRQRVDAIDCVTFDRDLFAAVRQDTQVSITGRLHRRFYRNSDGTTSRLEVVVVTIDPVNA